MFSIAVMFANSRMFWYVRDTPRWAIWSRRSLWIGCAVELDLARRDVVEPGDAVEEGRLPGAVRSDDADDGALVDLEVELVDREEPAEPLGDGAGNEQRHDIVPRVIGVVSPAIMAGASSPTCSSRRAMPDGHSPSGRYSIIPMSANP